MLLSEAVDAYMGHLVGASHTHQASVGSRLSRFLTGREGALLSDVTSEDIAGHFEGLAAAGLAMGTLAGHKSTMRAFFRWLVGQGILESDPAAILTGARFRYSYQPVNHQPADPEHFRRLVQALPGFAAAGSRRNVRDALIVSLTVDSSARRGEIWALRRADMERALARPTPAGENRHVYRAIVNGKTGPTVLRFFDESAALAHRWLALMPHGVWLFCSLRTGKRLRRDYMNQAFARACAFAGVPTFNFQAVRKRVVVDAIALAGDPKVGQLLAGHKDPRTTTTYYNLVQEEKVAQIAGRLATERRGRPSADGGDLADELFGPLR